MKCAIGTRTREPLFDILDERGIRRDWFASRLGVSRSFISMVESGQRRLTPARRRRAAEVLAVPEHLLFRPEEE